MSSLPPLELTKGKLFTITVVRYPPVDMVYPSTSLATTMYRSLFNLVSLFNPNLWVFVVESNYI